VNLFALFDSARTRLQVIPREGLGELVQPARILGIPRAPRIVSRGWVWHLGAILLSEDDVYATGDIIRAHQEVRRGYPAESQRRRAELAAAARRGGFVPLEPYIEERISLLLHPPLGMGESPH
jgi:hypothetical protein